MTVVPEGMTSASILLRWNPWVCRAFHVLSVCRIYERLKAEKQAEDEARDERQRVVDLMYQEQVRRRLRHPSGVHRLHNAPVLC